MMAISLISVRSAKPIDEEKMAKDGVKVSEKAIYYWPIQISIKIQSFIAITTGVLPAVWLMGTKHYR